VPFKIIKENGRNIYRIQLPGAVGAILRQHWNTGFFTVDVAQSSCEKRGMMSTAEIIHR
jgi:hypothetical protein